MRLSVFACLAAMLLSACKPFLIFPGGALPGSVSEPPANWSTLDAVKTIQLETRPGDPYSVNIWIISMDDALYIHAGANRAAWVDHLEADPMVRLGVEEQVYELRAERVEDQETFNRFIAAYEKKYGRRPRNENAAEVFLYRLTPRD